MKSLVNLGCGSRYHPAWTNIDIAPRGAGVIAHDLSRGIPLGDKSSDAVYHSAVLEHIRRDEALGFIKECRRVLKPGGIIRVAVPDLENICRLYLEKLVAARHGQQHAQASYDWMMIELLDQCVREESGGTMLKFLRRREIPNRDFLLQRIGVEGRQLMSGMDGRPASSGWVDKFSRAVRSGRLISRLVERAADFGLPRQLSRAFKIGQFRLAGEVHHWMYDDFSLGRLLVEAGFRFPLRQTAITSQIPEWNTYHLDCEADGTVVKPDLFYMEAIR